MNLHTHKATTMNFKSTIRTFTARSLAPVMRVTGFRFSKDYRNEVSRFHACVYAVVDVVGANMTAEGNQWRWS